MYSDRLPVARLTMLADQLPDMDLEGFAADLAALEELARYCVRDDTGGLISRELARVFVPDPRRLVRLQRARLVHDQYDALPCGCGVRTAFGCWSVCRDALNAVAW